MKYRPSIYRVRYVTISELCEQIIDQGPLLVASSMHEFATYHCSVSAFRAECTRICCSTSGESIGEEDQADTIDPSEVEDQWPEKSNGEIIDHNIYAEPQREHLKVSHCSPIMLLFRT